MKMKSVCAFAAMVSFGSAFAATTWYVDDDWYEKGGTGTESAPYGTIQQAVNAASAGDTILVAPGTYDQGAAGGYRVQIPNSDSKTNLTIRATGGRDVTFIVGRRHSDESPSGPNAIGGIWCGPWKGCTIIDGFTIQNCHRPLEGGSQEGAVTGHYDVQQSCQLFNCTITKCSGAAVYGATLHSSFVSQNIPVTNANSKIAFSYARAANCILTGNLAGFMGAQTRFVNCTIAGNSGNLRGECYTGFYNSILTLGTDCNLFQRPVTNSVISGNSIYGDSAPGNTVKNALATDIFAALDGFSDFRLRTDSPAANRGEPALLETIPLPPADRDPPDEPGRYSTYHDVYGRAIDMTAEHIHAGAIQEAVEIDDSVVGLISIKQNDKEPFLLDGETFLAGEAFMRTASACPTQWCLTAYSPETKPLSNIFDTLKEDTFAVDDGAFFRVADGDGKIWLTSAPIGRTRKVTVSLAKKIFYMDPNGNDSWDGLSAEHVEGTTTGPWQTFTNASARLNVECGRDETVMIRCAPGVYDKGEEDHVRVPLKATADWKRYHFVGTAGAEKTFVVGADATTPDADEHGCGANAVGCIFNGSVRCAGFTGFTFTGGRRSSEASSNYGAFAGLQIITQYGAYPWLVLCDSVISNNYASTGKIGSNEGHMPFVLERCRIAGNGAPQGTVFFTALLLGCIFDGNDGGRWGYIIQGSKTVAVNTTFAHNGLNNGYFAPSAVYRNSLLTDFGTGAVGLPATNFVGCAYDNSLDSDKIDRTRNTKVALAMYADRDGGDYRILSCSPAVGAARTDDPAYVTFATTDFEGNPVCRGVAPTVPGAHTVPLTEGVYVTDPNGYLLADGGKADGAHFISEGGELAISANHASATERPVVGITVNGETNLFTGAAGTIKIPFAAVEGTSLSVEPILSNTWYVNAGDDPGWAPGSDANCGWGTWAPFRTLTNAMAKAKSGDVVIAAPGRYAEGTVSVSENDAANVLKRVRVSPGVTLRSEQGAEKTFIVGEPAKTEADAYGCGADAVGCVNMQGKSKLEGFTLTDGYGHGRTDKTGASAVYGYISNDSVDATQISDCIISNCSAYTGILLYGRYRRCRIVGNRTLGSILLHNSTLSDVYIDHNRFKEHGDGYCYSQKAWTNVTWGADNLASNASGEWVQSTCGVTPHAIDAVNCIVFGNIKSGASGLSITNCLITAGTFKNVDDPSKIMLDAEGRPLVVEGNLALDTGLTELYDAGAMGDKDASGRPRVMNAALDIGALEADWRPRYSKDIGSRVTVTETTSGIVETDGRKVSFGAGGTVSFDWLCEADQKCELSVNVTGDGVLVMTREGEEPVEYATKGTHVYPFMPTATGVQRFTLTYVPAEDDTGTAEILRAKRDVGMVLIFR